jgi:hypothetical protein
MILKPSTDRERKLTSPGLVTTVMNIRVRVGCIFKKRVLENVKKLVYSRWNSEESCLKIARGAKRRKDRHRHKDGMIHHGSTLSSKC